MKKLTLALFVFFIFQSVAYAQESLEASVDCTNVQIDYADDSTLTRGERIHHMDKSLNRSLNKFELCQSETEEWQNPMVLSVIRKLLVIQLVVQKAELQVGLLPVQLCPERIACC